MAMAPRQLVVLGDSGVHGWGDRLGGGWCERLRLEWMGLPDAPVIYPLECVETDWRPSQPDGAANGVAEASCVASDRMVCC